MFIKLLFWTQSIYSFENCLSHGFKANFILFCYKPDYM